MALFFFFFYCFWQTLHLTSQQISTVLCLISVSFVHHMSMFWKCVYVERLTFSGFFWPNSLLVKVFAVNLFFMLFIMYALFFKKRLFLQKDKCVYTLLVLLMQMRNENMIKKKKKNTQQLVRVSSGVLRCCVSVSAVLPTLEGAFT